MRINPFIDNIKQGKRVKAGSFWLTTHRGLPVSNEPLPPAYTDRIKTILGILAAAERAHPTGPGANAAVNLGGKSGVGLSYKWLGKDAAGKRMGMVGVRIDDKHHLSVEMTQPPVAYFHREKDIFRVEVPPELHAAYAEILTRTPSKFIGPEGVEASTGTTEELVFKDHQYILGCDDAGTGTWSGDLVVASVLIDKDAKLPAVFDSKQLTREERHKVLAEIESSGVPYAWATVTPQEIDTLGFTPAKSLAFDRAIAAGEAKAGHRADIVLVDGSPLPLKSDRKISFLTRGESTSRAIAAASIVATCMHERLMLELHQKYPDWEFDKNLGYGQPGHQRLLEEKGISPVHRRSFNPMKKMLEQQLATSRNQSQMSIDL